MKLIYCCAMILVIFLVFCWSSGFAAEGRAEQDASIQQKSSLRIKPLNWKISKKGKTSDRIGSIAYGKGIYVGTGENGRIATSPDGEIWTDRVSGTKMYVSHVVFLNDQFIALSKGMLLTSTDGIKWIKRPLGTAMWLSYIIYENGLYIVTSIYGNPVAASSDLVKWSVTSLPDITTFSAPVYGNGQFIVAAEQWKRQKKGKGYENIHIKGGIYGSADGKNWTLRMSFVDRINEIIFLNGKFYAPYASDDGRMLISDDGISWTALQTGISRMHMLQYGNGQFMGASYMHDVKTGNFNPQMVLSEDGINWKTAIDLPQNVYVGNIKTRFSDGQFIVIGEQFDSQSKDIPLIKAYVWISKDGIDWASQSSGFPKSVTHLLYANRRLFATGRDGTIMTAPVEIE